MEYMAGGSLYDFIIKHGKLEESQAQYWFKIIIFGLEALRKAQIIHRDLKTENILLDKESHDANLKISDFGLSRKMSLEVTVGIGTPLYSAPEVVSRQTYDESVDMWSLGQVLFEMIYGRCLYKDALNLNQLVGFQRTTPLLLMNIFEEMDPQISEDCKDMIYNWFKFKAVERLTLD